MRKTTHALAVPAALLLVVGLSACKLPGASSSSNTETAAPQTENTPATAIPVIKPAEQKVDQHEEQEQAQETGKKKGFFSRFFGL